MINKYKLTDKEFQKINLIVLDVDDTLLNDSKDIPIQNIESIKMACSLGIKVVVASGRPLSKTTIDIYEKLNIFKEDNYFIAYNGASIYDVYTKEVLFSKLLEKDEIIELDNYFKTASPLSARYVHIDENVTVINPNKYSYLEYEYNLKDHVEGDYLSIKNVCAYKYQIADEPEIISQLYKNLKKEFHEKYNVVITMPCFLEFTKKGVDKYSAIKILSTKLNIKNDEIMTIGDSMNDYSMIKNAGIGVAMGNAINEIKSVCKLIVDTNEKYGVSQAVNLIINAKKLEKYVK